MDTTSIINDIAMAKSGKYNLKSSRFASFDNQLRHLYWTNDYTVLI